MTEGRVKNSKHVAVQDSGTDSAEESEANSSDSNSDSNTDSTGSSEEEIVASRPRKSNLPTGGVKGNYSKRGSRVKHLAEELVKVILFTRSPSQLLIRVSDSLESLSRLSSTVMEPTQKPSKSQSSRLLCRTASQSVEIIPTPSDSTSAAPVID